MLQEHAARTPGPVPPAPATPATLTVESRGIDTVPDDERWSRPKDVFSVVFGGANSISTALLGSFPVLLGLSFADGLVAVCAGVLLGSLVLAPMVLFGRQTGTNNAVASSAHFGVHGRIIGSFLSLLTAFTFLALAVWTAGDALAGTVSRLTGAEPSTWLTAVSYALLTLMTITICVFGYRLLVMLNRIVPAVVGVLFVLGVAAYAPGFDGGVGGSFGSGADRWSDPSFLGAFIGSVLIAMSCPISFGAFLGDYSRYVSKNVPSRRLMGAVFGAGVAPLVAFGFGLFTASAIATRQPDTIASGDYVGGLIALAPSWFFLPLGVIAVAGGLSTGTSLLYGTGLDFSSIVPRLGRVASTLVIAALATVLIFVGKFAFEMVGTVSTLSTLVVICTVPWMVVMIVGYVTRGGWYAVDDLHVFNRRQRGGVYWYRHGWNVPTTASYLISAALSLMFVSLPGHFVGPFASLVGGTDISIAVALGSSFLLSVAVARFVPQPSYVVDGNQPDWVPVRRARPEPIAPRGA
ncbi:purine-cytosine permease family protein [Embleya hyalina]|uniref:Nitrate reductase n=1 Tax=Embleya hyalina TaxID=516124 RepID=A0A401YEQ2_9ACTN|nr:cytosine permease [Embleya hyalina]GCD93082.1 nitrate reductase [Embleya hyalina]